MTESPENMGREEPAKPDVAYLENAGQWFALRVRAKAEPTVNRELQLRGVETLCPTYLERRRYSDRIKTLELALFPGYLFSRFEWTSRLRVLNTPGVDSIVGFGPQPHPVDPAEIQALSTVVSSGVIARPHPFLKVGQRVHVQSGPLSGCEGILVATKSDYRLVISVTLLQRSVVAELDSADVRTL